MKRHTHDFVEQYSGLAAFGMDRQTDEETLVYYLQKFSDDELISALVKRMSDADISLVYDMINTMLKRYLSEAEYHNLFLKDGTH